MRYEAIPDMRAAVRKKTTEVRIGNKIFDATAPVGELVISEQYLTGMEQVQTQKGDVIHYKKVTTRTPRAIVGILIGKDERVGFKQTRSEEALEALFGQSSVHRPDGPVVSPRQSSDEIREALANGKIDIAVISASENLDPQKRMKIIEEFTVRHYNQFKQYEGKIRMQVVGNGVVERRRGNGKVTSKNTQAA